jgi:hypothetical protein
MPVYPRLVIGSILAFNMLAGNLTVLRPPRAADRELATWNCMRITGGNGQRPRTSVVSLERLKLLRLHGMTRMALARSPSANPIDSRRFSPCFNGRRRYDSEGRGH